MRVKNKTFSSTAVVVSTPTNKAQNRYELSKLGQDLKSLRKANRLTLEMLALKAGKSVSFLSKIERGQARPSITSLQDIAEILNVQIGWFFQNEEVNIIEDPYIVRANQRRRLYYSTLSSTNYMGFEDYLLSANLNGNLALGISHYASGGTTGDDLYQHEGEEAGMIMKGTITLFLEDKSFILLEGDSFSFASNIPHRYQNFGVEEAMIVWANTPISLQHK